MILKRVLWLILVYFTYIAGAREIKLTESPSQNLTSPQPTFTMTLQPTSTMKILFSNSTQASISRTTSASSNISSSQSTLSRVDSPPSTTDSQAEIIHIFHGVVNTINGTKTAVEDEIQITEPFYKCFNSTSCSEHMLNETIRTNYTIVAEVVNSSNDLSAYRLEKTAAIAAGVFLVSAVLGYLSCIGYRRHLQRKYDSGQILIPQDVYDTTDLRYFEI